MRNSFATFRCFLEFSIGLLFLSACGKDPPAPAFSSTTYVYEYGTPISFGLGGQSERFRVSGWGQTEQNFTWTVGPAASVAFRLPKLSKPAELQAQLAGYIHPPDLPAQPVNVYANGEKIASWRVAEGGTYRASISPELIGSRDVLTIDFHVPQAISPAEKERGGDPRRLGVRCTQIVLTATDSETTPAGKEASDQTYTYGTLLRFGKGQNGLDYTGAGWNEPEVAFSWTDRGPAELTFQVQTPHAPITLTVRAGGVVNLPTKQTMEVSVKGQKLATWELGKPTEFSAIIPPELVADGVLKIELRVPLATSPKAAGLSSDSRVLGAQCLELKITAPD